MEKVKSFYSQFETKIKEILHGTQHEMPKKGNTLGTRYPLFKCVYVCSRIFDLFTSH